MRYPMIEQRTSTRSDSPKELRRPTVALIAQTANPAVGVARGMRSGALIHHRRDYDRAPVECCCRRNDFWRGVANPLLYG